MPTSSSSRFDSLRFASRRRDRRDRCGFICFWFLSSIALTFAFVVVVVVARTQVVVGGNGSVNEDKFSLSVAAPFAGDGSVTLNARPNYRPCAYRAMRCGVMCSIYVDVHVHANVVDDDD